LSWYEPQPKQKPKRLPRRRPIKAIPSGIGDEGIVGNWLFYYMKGGDHLHDFSPEDNHGTVNGASWKDGSYGWALEFDGVDDSVDTNTDDFFDLTAPLTISLWMKVTTSINDALPFVSKYDGDGYIFKIHLSTLAFWFGGNTHSSKDISGTISQDTWYYVGVTWDGSDVKYYIDGDLFDTVSTTDSIIASAVTLKMGKRDGNYWEGRLNELRIYKVAKSSSWFSRRFARTKGIFK